MRNLPLWAWLIVLSGLVTIGVGALFHEGSYPQAVSVQLGATALLLVPIILAERSIVSTLAKKAEEAAAIQRTEQFLHFDEMWSDFGQALQVPRPPVVGSEQLERMLGMDGWSMTRARDRYTIWAKNGRLFAVPLDMQPLPRGVVRGVMRVAGWSRDRTEELWNATGPNAGAS